MISHASCCSRLRSDRGQSIVEFAICLPLLIVLTLGVVETSNALLSQHIITKVAREGSNMTSRETTLVDAATVLQNMSSAPGTFNATTRVIFSVLLRSQTGSNNGQLVLYQRHSVGNAALGNSQLNGSCGSCTAATDYTAANPNNDASLRVTNAPAGIATVPGGMIYVTEVYTSYTAMTPLNNFGITLPSVLYSIAYF